MGLFKSAIQFTSSLSLLKGVKTQATRETNLEWSSSLTRVDALLDGLITVSENEFLTVAENLQEYYTRAQKMCEKSSEIVTIMTGGGLTSATVGLDDILGELRNHLERSQAHFSQMSKVLFKHQSEISKITSHTESFKLHVLNLNMLGFLTQVENAHISDINTGFKTLTDDVKSLSKIIENKSININSVSVNVQSFITHALTKIADFEKSQNENTRITLEKALSNHSALSKKIKRASQSAKIIEEVSKNIAVNIGEIVISMQFHDITRQQLEHVKEVLDHMISKINEGDYSNIEQAALIRDVLKLQHAQLRKSHEELAEAVFNVIASLQNITTNVSDVLMETHEVAWASDTQEQSFMEGIENGISSVIDCIKTISDEHAKLSETVSEASEMVLQMSVFVKDIETLGLNLQLIALNARIKAAHLGSEGAMLDTISGNIYALSKEAREDTKNLSLVLETLVNLSRQFKDDMILMQEGQSQTIGLMVDKLKNLTTQLSNINDTVNKLLESMKVLGESLLVDLQDTTDEITVHDKVEYVLKNVLNIIEETAENAQTICPSGFESVALSILSDLDRLYTTKSERDIHVQHVDASLQEDQKSGTTQNGEDWDNLELF